MISHKEQVCIEKSFEAKKLAVTNKMSNLQKKWSSFCYAISMDNLAAIWHQYPYWRLALLPLYPAVALLHLIIVLYKYTIQFIESKFEDDVLYKDFDDDNCPNSDSVPDIKTIGQLWSLQGPSEYLCDDDERLELLKYWVTVLYGKETLHDLQIEQRINAIQDRNAEARKRQSQVNGGGFICLRFISIVDALIRELSNELPEYN